MNRNNEPRTRGILIATCSGTDGLLEQLPESTLLPLVDRPLILRAAEMLVALGCRQLEVVLHDKPEMVRELLGDGTRLGCEIGYHYCRDGAGALDLVWIMPGDADDCLWLGNDQALPRLSSLRNIASDLDRTPEGRVVLFGEAGRKGEWTGWGRFTLGYLRALAAHRASQSLLSQLVLHAPRLDRVYAKQVWDASSARSLIAAQANFLIDPDAPLGIGVPLKSPGIWLSPKATIHPDALVRAPAFIGPDCIVEARSVIGPNAVILERSIVSRNCTVSDALVLPGTCIGEDLDVRRSIVASDLYLNAALDTVLEIRDPGLIAPLHATGRNALRIPMWHRIAAAVLWLALTPLFFIHRLRGNPLGFDPAGLAEVKHALFRSHRHGWRRHFERVLLPNLRAIVVGRMRLTGLELRNPLELETLDSKWRALYRRCTMGVVSESLFLGEDGLAADSRRVADFYACAHLNFRATLGLLWRYGAHLVRELWHGGEKPVLVRGKYHHNESQNHQVI